MEPTARLLQGPGRTARLAAKAAASRAPRETPAPATASSPPPPSPAPPGQVRFNRAFFFTAVVVLPGESQSSAALIPALRPTAMFFAGVGIKQYFRSKEYIDVGEPGAQELNIRAKADLATFVRPVNCDIRQADAYSYARERSTLYNERAQLDDKIEALKREMAEKKAEGLA